VRGKFITVEGVDGAGKSSHLQFIADLVGQGGRHVIVTREPGGTDLAERLRKVVLEEPMDPVVETLLVFAARADHVAPQEELAMASAADPEARRFTDATLAYQGAGNGVPAEFIRRLAEVTHGALKPDRTLVFDCSYEVARERLAKSGKKLDRFEREDRAFHERVRAAYQALAREEPARVRLIDASGDFAAIRSAVGRELAGI